MASYTNGPNMLVGLIFQSHLVITVFKPISSIYCRVGEGFSDSGYHSLTQFTWNDSKKCRTGPRTGTTVSVMGPRLVLGPLLLLV